MTDIGIIGGGQLARMMIYRSAHLGLSFTVLDPDPACSARPLCAQFLQGSLQDAKALKALAATSRVLTYDIEHVGVETLLELEASGTVLRPSPRVLAVVQDKYRQKEVLAAARVPQPAFYPDDPGLRPAVQKTRRGGYDGRGVRIHREFSGEGLVGDTYWEELVEAVRELAVVTVRDATGHTVAYPPVEMVFDPDLNICDQVLLPARITASVREEALRVAMNAAKAFSPLGLEGVLAVELFETADGRVLVNEVAPRPHNSGHVTMETCSPCQFEAHIRVVAGLPLPEPHCNAAAWMKNLLGHGDGLPVLEGIEALADPALRLHLYAKPLCRTGRKMGHLTAVAPTPEEALAFAARVGGRRVIGGPIG